MILLLIMVPYRIEAGFVEIINRNKNLFKSGVTVYSENLYIEAKNGIETSTYLELFDSVYIKYKEINFTAERCFYYTPNEKLFARGDIKIWKNDTIKGDSLIFDRNKEIGTIIGNFIFISDSNTIKGRSGVFHKDTVKVGGSPRFISPRMIIDSDSIIYITEDSTFTFLSNVHFDGIDVNGSGGRLKHFVNKKYSMLSDSPYIFQERDSITGDVIEIDHKNKILNAYSGIAINYAEEGRNIVEGNTVKVYYNENSIDSVVVFQDAWGKFSKYETGIQESR